MGTVATVVLDDVDVTDLALSGSVTTRLNGLGQATVRLPMESAFGGAGSYLKVYFETDLDTMPILYHHGRVMDCEDSADENGGYTVYNSSDPLELWQWRPVRDPDGDFTNPKIILTQIYGPQIIQAMMTSSQNTVLTDADAEGPLRLQYGSFDGGTVPLYATPTDWPMTMAELASLLVSTGQVDIVITPIEFDSEANYGRIDVYNGNYGLDLTSTVIFQYGTGLHNIRSLRRNEDMSRVVNKLWYYLGPRKDQQHWQDNVTATDTAGFAACGIDLTVSGGIQELLSTSRGEDYPPFGGGGASNRFDPTAPGAYDVRMEIQVHDDRNDEASLGYCLFRWRWAEEQFLRLNARTLVHITPTRDTAIGEFGVGDLVLVEAHADVRGGFSGAQRVYEYTIGWDTDSVCAIDELQVSSDNEGFTVT